MDAQHLLFNSTAFYMSTERQSAQQTFPLRDFDNKYLAPFLLSMYENSSQV